MEFFGKYSPVEVCKDTWGHIGLIEHPPNSHPWLVWRWGWWWFNDDGDDDDLMMIWWWWWWLWGWKDWQSALFRWKKVEVVMVDSPRLWIFIYTQDVYLLMITLPRFSRTCLFPPNWVLDWKTGPWTPTLRSLGIFSSWRWWLYFSTATKGSSYFWIYLGECFQLNRILIKHWCFFFTFLQQLNEESPEEEAAAVEGSWVQLEGEERQL